MNAQREESDLIGSRGVPPDVYFGIHTLRARDNFPSPVSRCPLTLS